MNPLQLGVTSRMNPVVRLIEDYSASMGFADKSDRMTNSYGIARRTWKWTKKLFFHLTDMTILNAFLNP
jgi:predicted transcriptional regulator